MTTQFSKKRGGPFFPRLLKRAVLDQPTVDSGGISGGRSVAVAVGCGLFDYNGTSMALEQHFQGTSTKKREKKLHRSRESLSLVSVIFTELAHWADSVY